MTLGRYIASPSWLHRLDPRTKILCGLALAFLALKMNSPVYLGSIVLALLLFPFFTMLPFYITGKLQSSILPLLAVVFFVNAGLTPGQPVELSFCTLNWITTEGLARGSTLALRLNTMVLIFAWVSISTSPSELSDSLEALLRPLNRIGIPTRDLVLALAVALRFVPLVLLEAERIYQAQVSRGAHFSGMRRLTHFIPVLMPLFVATFTRAERLTQTLESRGYRSILTRSQYQTLTFRRCDFIALLTVGCPAAFIFVAL
jgi:energy-coupling factor transport system permease protein